MTEFVLFVVGVCLPPLLLSLLAKFDPDSFARFVVALLEKIFRDKETRNKVSNALGVRFVLFGLSLITAIEDQATIKQRIEAVLDQISDILIEISRTE